MLQHIAPLIFMTLAMIVVSFLTLGILAPVTMAGYMHSILLLIREKREPKVQDIFSHMRLFFPLFLFGIVVFFITLIGIKLFFLPGFLFVMVVSFCCIYMLPLMTDRNLGLVDAIKKSYSMATKEQFADQIIVFILFVGISAIGGSVFIGSLFTQPFATLFLLSVYDKLVKPLPESPPGPPPGPMPLNGE